MALADRRLDLRWVSVSMVDGHVLAEFPDTQWSTLESRLNDYATSTVTIPWDSMPVNWFDATTPAKVAFLLLAGDNPIWGGWVQERQRNLGDPALSLSLVTIEGYFERVILDTHTFRQVGQTEIAALLVTNEATRRSCIIVDPLLGVSAVKRDRTYLDKDDKTLLSALQDLSNVTNGIDWTVQWRYEGGSVYKPHVIIADYIGTFEPVTTFNVESLTSFSVNDSYTSDNGANRVRATSSADGDVRPQSPWLEDTDTSRPLFERSFTPSSSITNINTLTAHAQAEITQTKDGAHFVSLGLDFLTAPVLGTEWNKGDVVAWSLPEIREQFPDFWNGQARCIGYSIAFGENAPTVTPVFAMEGDMR